LQALDMHHKSVETEKTTMKRLTINYT